MAVRIVTDSSSDLPDKLAEKFEISIVPLNVHFGEEVLKDGVDIWSEEFYHRLRNEQWPPNTSQPSPGEFLRVYREIARPGDTIISLHISTEMSGTAGAARIAAGMLGEEYRVEAVDTRLVSMALGLISLRAAKMARDGSSVAAILEAVSRLEKEIAVYFTVNSLEHLCRTGRIGKATAFLGSLLNIKPLLGIAGGLIIPVEKIRGNFQKVAQAMVANIYEKYGNRPLEISIVHTELPDHFNILRKTAEETLNIAAFYPGVIGPIVGSHAGPNTIGIIGLPVA